MNSVRKLQIENAVAYARDHPISLKELDEQEANESRNVREYLNHVVSHLEIGTATKTNPSKLQEIILYSIEELKYVLEHLPLSKEDYEDSLVHETAHFIVAMKGGFLTRFIVIVFRDEKNKLGAKIGTQVNLRVNNFTEEQKRSALRQTISAPIHLSDQDRIMLQK